ncbi:hypothetical protein G6F59_014483 [Rhizopus arrhizus]|nr:hypothetical protein G6F59_014483 [Rhizopus arrhizus]
MLRHYAPYKVAENFNLLAALAPGRVDLGVGKAPGGLPASTAALAAGRPGFADFDQQLRDLEGYLSGAEGEALARPLPQQAPERFLLGASPQSAKQAAELGWRFVYAAHFDGDPKHIEPAFEAYRSASTQPPLLATVAFAAPTTEAAARHIGALRVYKLHLGPGQTVNLPSPEAAAENTPERAVRRCAACARRTGRAASAFRRGRVHPRRAGGRPRRTPDIP